jgi:hypothetical protein
MRRAVPLCLLGAALALFAASLLRHLSLPLFWRRGRHRDAHRIRGSTERPRRRKMRHEVWRASAAQNMNR